MAWTFIANRGTNTSKASGTTLAVSPTGTIAAGRILVVRCASDDTTGTGPTHTVSDSAGNTYESLVYTSASSDAGSSACSIHISKLTTQLTTGSSVTLTLGSARVTKVIELTEFSVAAGYTYALGGSNAAGGTGTFPSVAISGLSSIARLWVGLVSAEGPSTGSFTEDADYSNTVTAGTTGNPAASNLKVSGGNRIATQTGDTYNPTISSTDWRTVLAAINETAIPAANFAADVSGAATTVSVLDTSITMSSSESGTASADATLTTFEVSLAADISGQANSTAVLTTGADEIFGSMSDYLENQIIKHIFRTGSFTKPTELWISLHTAQVNEDGTGTEATGNNYGRAQLNPSDSNWSAVGGGGTNALTSNAVSVTFPTPSGSWGQITYAGIWDASTSGNMLFFCELVTPYTANAGEGAPIIVPGGLQININVPPLTDFIPIAASISATATASGTILGDIFSDNFETADMPTIWEVGGNGFVWDDAYSFYWHRSTDNPHAGTYSAKCHWAQVNTSTFTSPHGTPTLGQTPGGTLGARTYYVKTVYARPNNPTGTIKSYYSNEASFSVSANNLLTVTSPASGEAFYHYLVYAGTSTGDANLKLQNSTAVNIGTNWTESTEGLANLGAYPSFTADSGSLTRFFNRKPNGDTGIGLHIFKRGYFYLSTPATGASKTIQRKLMRSSNASASPNHWEGILTIQDSDGTGNWLRYGNQGDTLSAQNAFNTQGVFNLSYDTWHCIELEEHMNIPVSSSNATIRLWVDGTLRGENTSFRVRGVTDEPIAYIEFGDQLQTSGGAEMIDEIWYWDDIVVADSYIGL